MQSQEGNSPDDDQGVHHHDAPEEKADPVSHVQDSLIRCASEASKVGDDGGKENDGKHQLEDDSREHDVAADVEQ